MVAPIPAPVIQVIPRISKSLSGAEKRYFQADVTMERGEVEVRAEPCDFRLFCLARRQAHFRNRSTAHEPTRWDDQLVREPS